MIDVSGRNLTKMTKSKDIKSNQIISIVGATATGKTALALELAAALLEQKIFKQVHLLSADSRQVYVGLENLTGADVTPNFVASKSANFSHPFFQNQDQNIFLHGVSIIEPNQEWSAAHFRQLFQEIASQLSEKALLVVVGGTGFYQKQLATPAASLGVPQNQTLRQKLETLSAAQLQIQLQLIDPNKLTAMNNSDRHNPRRLVRAIELSDIKQSTPAPTKTANPHHPIFYLQIDKLEREAKIKARVEQRFAAAHQEVASLLQQKTTSSLAATSTGFHELTQLIRGETDRTTCQKLWQLAEIQYAKRQDTWWKKQQDLIEISNRPPLQFVLNYLKEVY